MLSTVVPGDERVYPLVQLCYGFIATDVDVIVFDGTPETFHHYIVQGMATTIQNYFDPMVLQDTY